MTTINVRQPDALEPPSIKAVVCKELFGAAGGLSITLMVKNSVCYLCGSNTNAWRDNLRDFGTNNIQVIEW